MTHKVPMPDERRAALRLLLAKLDLTVPEVELVLDMALKAADDALASLWNTAARTHYDAAVHAQVLLLGYQLLHGATDDMLQHLVGQARRSGDPIHEVIA